MSSPRTALAAGQAVAIAADAAILAAYCTHWDPAQRAYRTRLLRLSPDGRRDRAFTGGGLLRRRRGFAQSLGGVLPQPDGKILVAGQEVVDATAIPASSSLGSTREREDEKARAAVVRVAALERRAAAPRRRPPRSRAQSKNAA